jgi:hypothetical protein
MVFVMLRDTENTAEDAKAAIVDEDLKYDSFKTIYVTKDFKITLQDINTELDIRWRTDISDESQSGNYLRWWADKVTPPPPATGTHPIIADAWLKGAFYLTDETRTSDIDIVLQNNSDVTQNGILVKLTTTYVATSGYKEGQTVTSESYADFSWRTIKPHEQLTVNTYGSIDPIGGASGYIKKIELTVIEYDYYDESGKEISVKIPADERVTFNVTKTSAPKN